MIELIKKHNFFKDTVIKSINLFENQGYCNDNYLITCENEKYILRKLLKNDINRDFEYKVSKLAFKINISPEPLLFEKDNSFMLFEFIEGVHKNNLETNDLTLLAKALQSLHNIKIGSHPIKLDIKSNTNQIKNAFETISKYPNEYVLCHSDLNSQNILFIKNKVKLIDWEYAGVMDRYFDFASIIIEFNLNKEEENIFLLAYDQNIQIQQDKLTAYKHIYKILCQECFKDNKKA